MTKTQLLGQLVPLRNQILPRAVAGGEFFHWQIGETLNQLRDLLLEISPAEERSMFQKLILPIEIESKENFVVNPSNALRLCDQLIGVCKGDSAPPATANQNSVDGGLRRIVPSTKTVLIIHGHDAANLLRLRALLKERWSLHPLILAESPGKGRTLVEKFEEEASRTSFAFALLTPDDLVQSKDRKYLQPRPNVIFELGWFYGRLGRQRVCILFREGTLIHSDLDGILRIEFRESIEEKVVELESELKAAGLLQ